MRGMLICPQELDVVLCGITVKNIGLSISLVGCPYATQ